jgi:hypothetical protein
MVTKSKHFITWKVLFVEVTIFAMTGTYSSRITLTSTEIICTLYFNQILGFLFILKLI